jgi:competence protein ComEA
MRTLESGTRSMTAEPGMRSRSRSTVSGTGLVALLLAGVLAWAIWGAWYKPVRLNEFGAAIDPAADASWPDMRLDINAASAAELALLPGLGPALAERIVQDRSVRGPFASIEALDRVRGIGPSIIDRLRPFVFITHPDVQRGNPTDVVSARLGS